MYRVTLSFLDIPIDNSTFRHIEGVTHTMTDSSRIDGLIPTGLQFEASDNIIYLVSPSSASSSASYVYCTHFHLGIKSKSIPSPILILFSRPESQHIRVTLVSPWTEYTPHVCTYVFRLSRSRNITCKERVAMLRRNVNSTLCGRESNVKIQRGGKKYKPPVTTEVRVVCTFVQYIIYLVTSKRERERERKRR